MKTLCKTIANNPCDYLVITSSKGKKKQRKERMGVVIIAR